jgi:hypothetical protein
MLANVVFMSERVSTFIQAIETEKVKEKTFLFNVKCYIFS